MFVQGLVLSSQPNLHKKLFNYSMAMEAALFEYKISLACVQKCKNVTTTKHKLD